MNIKYEINKRITASQFIELLEKSTLGVRRPIDDQACMQGMVDNSNLMVSAWHDEQLVGIARSMTDFHYACYLSDLAVHKDYQHNGIGKMLLKITQQQLGKRCKLILIAAPAADSYYDNIGFTRNPRCWVLESDEPVR